MEDEQIKEFLGIAISRLQDEDIWLLQHDLSEQSVSHKLAEYLQSSFAKDNYNVDCEYNGDINDGNGRKRIQILRSRLEELGLIKFNETDLEEEFIERAVFPDIIVHKRGSNNENLLIIEVKKASSKVPFDYDDLKLIAYTTSDHGNHLKYQLGAFIVTSDKGDCSIIYYKNGEKTD